MNQRWTFLEAVALWFGRLLFLLYVGGYITKVAGLTAEPPERWLIYGLILMIMAELWQTRRILAWTLGHLADREEQNR